MVPWYQGFVGSIEKHDEKKEGEEYLSTGKVEVIKNPSGKKCGGILHVTELPVGRWMDDFKALLDKLCQEGARGGEPVVETYAERNTESKVDFEVRLTSAGGELLGVSGKSLNLTSAVKVLKLQSKISMCNMVAFSAKGEIRRYADPREIVAEFVPERLKLYEERRLHEEAELKKDLTKARNKARFIGIVADGSLVLKGKSRKVLETELRNSGFDTSAALNTLASPEDAGIEGDGEGSDDTQEGGKEGDGYAYLLRMPIWSATAERLKALEVSNANLCASVILW